MGLRPPSDHSRLSHIFISIKLLQKADIGQLPVIWHAVDLLPILVIMQISAYCANVFFFFGGLDVFISV